MKTKTSMSIIACFTLLLLLTFDLNVKPSYAQTFQVISGFAQPIIAMHYQPENDSIWVITEGSGKTLLYEVDRSSKTIIGTFNHTKNFDDLALGASLDIWCGKTDCFVTTTTGGVAKISTEDIAPNIFRGQNVTATVFSPVVAPFYHITGRDEVTGGFGSITMWVDGCSEAVATCDGTFRTIDGISMTIVSTAVAYATSNNGALHAHDVQWSGIAGITDNLLITGTGVTTDSASTNFLRVYDLTQSPILQSCSTQFATQSNVYDVAVNFVGAGSVNNKIYVASHTGTLYVFDENCTLLQSISASDTGLTSDIRFIEYGSGRIFMQEDGGIAKISQLLVNSTGHVITTGEPNIYFPLPSVSQPLFISDSFTTSHSADNMILLSGNGQLWFPYSSTEKELGVLTYDSSLEEPPAGGGNAVNGRCGVGTVLDCVGDRSIGLAVTGGQDITVVSGGLFCGIGLNSTCSGDVKENGTGLLLMLITGSFFAIALIGAIATANTKFGAGISFTEIPKEFWLLLVVGVVAFAFYAQWIPDIIFYGLVVGLAGLFSFGLYRHIRG